MSAPAAEPVFNRLHPASFPVALAGIVRRYVVPGLVVWLVGSGRAFELMFMWLAIPAVAWALAKYLSVEFALTDEQLILKEGIFERSVRRIPLAKIHSLETRQGLVHRVFGVDDVLVHTGSGSSAEATLSALGGPAVAALKARLRAARGEEPAAETAVGEPPGRVLTAAELVGYGMIYNHGALVLLVLLGALWQLELLPLKRIFTRAQAIVGLAASSPIGFVAAGVAVVLFWFVLLRVGSVVWSLVMLHGFTVRRDGDQVRLSFGLLFHRDLTLPARRFHVLQLEERLLHRWEQRVTISAWTAATWGGEDGEAAGEAGEFFKTQLVHPLAERPEAGALVREITGEPDWESLDWRPLGDRAFRRFLAQGLLGVPVATVLSIALYPWGLAAWPALVAVAAWRAWVAARWTRYAVTAHGVWLRTGFLRRRWRVIGHGHIQAIELVESPFDRRNDMATLLVDAPCAPLGSHAVEVPFLPRGRALEVSAEVGRIAARRSLAW